MAAFANWFQRVGFSNSSQFLAQPRRLLQTLWHDWTDGGLDLRATSLVYTTLLSLAPLLAVSFSVLKAFGAHNQMRPLILEMLAPLGGQSAEIADRIIGFVNNLEVGVLGFTGFALLFWTVLSLLQKIEDSFNHIWRVKKSRSLRRRFSEYLSVLLVGPVLVFSAIGLMASMTSHGIVQAIIALEPFGTLYLWLVRLLPTLFIIAAFTFLYIFLPNTRVSFRAALTGGLVAGLAWRLAGWLFGEFVAGSTQYAAIYSSFAILIVFIIWLYVNWLILLLGVDISFYAQHPRHLWRTGRDVRSDHGLLRRTGLMVMALLADRFHRGEKPWTVAELSTRLDWPDSALESVLETLHERGLVLAVAGEGMAWVPGREPGELPVVDILAALEMQAGEGAGGPAHCGPVVDSVLDRLKSAEDAALAGMSLRELVGSTGKAEVGHVLVPD